MPRNERLRYDESSPSNGGTTIITSYAETDDRSPRPWWMPHWTTIICGLVLVASLVSVNLRAKRTVVGPLTKSAAQNDEIIEAGWPLQVTFRRVFGGDKREHFLVLADFSPIIASNFQANLGIGLSCIFLLLIQWELRIRRGFRFALREFFAITAAVSIGYSLTLILSASLPWDTTNVVTLAITWVAISLLLAGAVEVAIGAFRRLRTVARR